MPAGLQIFNDDGAVIIDENYFNLVLRQKVEGNTIATEYVTGTGSKITLNYNGPSYPLIAWQCAEEIMMQGFTRSGTNFDFTMRCAGTAGTAYTLFVFGEPDPIADYGNFGLEVFNAAGQRVYHSGAKPARIVDFRSVSGGIAARTNIAYTAGRQYATAMTRPATTNFPSPASPGPPFPPPFYINTSFGGCRGYSGGVSTKGWLGARSGPYPGTTSFPTFSQTGNFLVLDVTNY